MKREVEREVFERALEFTLRWEGGLVHDKDDPGGRTNRGVTQGVYDLYLTATGQTPRPVDDITEQQIKDLYYSRYWAAGNCPGMPEKVARAHFDAAVNCGTRRAARMLQRAVGAEEDGVVGPATLRAIRQFDETEVVDEMLDERQGYYERLVEHWQKAGKKRPKKYLQGWSNRVEALRSELS